MNVGERGEILLKIKLTEKRDRGETFNGEAIISVGFDGREYGSVPQEYYDIGESVIDNSRYDGYIEKIARVMSIGKASTSNKSDIHINRKGYSVKSSAVRAALINHTNRSGFERVCGEVKTDIGPLDEMINEYWHRRMQGIINEDISNSNPNSPFKDHKEYFRPILEYFLFSGSGSRKSANPAEYILEYSKFFDDKTWSVLTKEEAVDKVWPNLVFSLRSKKGMPQNYTLDYRGPDAESIKKWVRKMDGQYKGALHVRVSKSKNAINKGPNLDDF